VFQRCKINFIAIENLSLYTLTVVTDFADTISGSFFLKCLIQIQKTISYFQIKSQNYKTRNIKHIMIITPDLIYTCLLVLAVAAQHDIKPLFNISLFYPPPSMGIVDCLNYVIHNGALQSFSIHTDFKR